MAFTIGLLIGIAAGIGGMYAIGDFEVTITRGSGGE